MSVTIREITLLRKHFWKSIFFFNLNLAYRMQILLKLALVLQLLFLFWYERSTLITKKLDWCSYFSLCVSRMCMCVWVCQLVGLCVCLGLDEPYIWWRYVLAGKSRLHSTKITRLIYFCNFFWRKYRRMSFFLCYTIFNICINNFIIYIYMLRIWQTHKY